MMVIKVPATPSMRAFYLQDMMSQVEGADQKEVIVLRGKDALSSIVTKFITAPPATSQKNLPEYTDFLYFKVFSVGKALSKNQKCYNDLAVCLRRWMLRELTRAIAYHIALLGMTWYKAADSVCELYNLGFSLEHETMIRYFQRYHTYHLGQHRNAFYLAVRRKITKTAKAS